MHHPSMSWIRWGRSDRFRCPWRRREFSLIFYSYVFWGGLRFFWGSTLLLQFHIVILFRFIVWVGLFWWVFRRVYWCWVFPWIIWLRRRIWDLSCFLVFFRSDLVVREVWVWVFFPCLIYSFRLYWFHLVVFVYLLRFCVRVRVVRNHRSSWLMRWYLYFPWYWNVIFRVI